MRELYQQIIYRWNRCEDLLKKAERLRGEVVMPAVNELRYAGRRIVDALCAINSDKPDEIRFAEAKKYANEAFMFCMRAEHDCVDSIILYAHIMIDQYESQYDAIMLRQVCPSLTSYRQHKRRIDDLVAASREDRDSRDSKYQEIIDNHLDDMIDIAYDLQGSEDLIKEASRKRLASEEENKKMAKYGIRLGWAGIFAGIIVGYIFYTLSKP
jgi:hypothetical protein